MHNHNGLAKAFVISLLVIALSFCTGASATLIDRGRGLVYDNDRNITWLADANLALTESFGISGIGSGGLMNVLATNSGGYMSWHTAQTWIAALNSSNYLGYHDWRLPKVIDTGSPGCNFAYSGTDCGWNVDTASSEMAHLFQDELGNKPIIDATRHTHMEPGWGLVHTAPFRNVETYYWSGTTDAVYTDTANDFNFLVGNQDQFLKTDPMFVWLVRDGDVSNVPEPQTLALLGFGVVGIVLRWRKIIRGEAMRKARR